MYTTTGGATITYNLDGVGNRTTVIGGGNPGDYTLDDTTPEPADFRVNQYTTTPADGLEYDANGNLVALRDGSGELLVTINYDYRNPMIEYVEYIDEKPDQRYVYKYDALGRRISKGNPKGAIQGRQLFF